MSHLPIMFNFQDKNCLIIGAGKIASKRAHSLLNAGAILTIIAPDISPEIQKLNATIKNRQYLSDDLKSQFAVVIATNNPSVNNKVAQDARNAKVLINHTQHPQLSDFHIPAIRAIGPITIAVSTTPPCPSAAANIADQITQNIDPNWPTLIQIAATYRQNIIKSQQRTQIETKILSELTSTTALMKLKQHGTDALKQYYDNILKSHTP